MAGENAREKPRDERAALDMTQEGAVRQERQKLFHDNTKLVQYSIYQILSYIASSIVQLSARYGIT